MVGDVATAGVPRAGVFARGGEGGRRRTRGGDPGEAREPHDGRGSCYIEFGEDRIARVDIDFLRAGKDRGLQRAVTRPSAREGEEFGSSRKSRWFNR